MLFPRGAALLIESNILVDKNDYVLLLGFKFPFHLLSLSRPCTALIYQTEIGQFSFQLSNNVLFR